MHTLSLSPSRLVLAAALAALLTAPATAQQGTATLVAVVTDAATGEPLGDAQVRLRGLRAGGATDGSGRLTLRGLPSGTVAVEVTRLGYNTLLAEVALLAGLSRNLPLEMRVDPVALDPIRAQATTREGWARQMLEGRGFFQRRQTGQGVFMARNEIARSNARTMTQLLSRFRRLNIDYDEWGPTPPTRRQQQSRTPRRACRPAFFVDGILVEGFDVNSVRPESIEALEIYRGASELPPAFNRGTNGCGAVLIWTRVS